MNQNTSVPSNSYNANPYTIEQRHPSQRLIGREFTSPESLMDVLDHPPAFGIVSETDFIPPPSVEDLTKDRKRELTTESLYELKTIPNYFDKAVEITPADFTPRLGERYPIAEKTVNKYIRSDLSQCELTRLPPLQMAPSNTATAVENTPEVTSSMYRYDFAAPSDSSYAYVNKDFTLKDCMLFTDSLAATVELDQSNGSSLSPNPYRTLPQYLPCDWTYQHSSENPVPTKRSQSLDSVVSHGSVETVHQIAAIPDDIFTRSVDDMALRRPRMQQTRTLNKNLYGAESQMELRDLAVCFDTKDHLWDRRASSETLNKKLLAPDSLYELKKIPSICGSSISLGKEVFRDYCLQSLEDLRLLPSFSSISLSQSSPSVVTAKGIASNEEFEYFPTAIAISPSQ